MNEFTRKLREADKKPDSEIENHQKLVSLEVDSDNSDDESDDTEANERPPPNIAEPSDLRRKTLGALMRSQNCLKISQDNLGFLFKH